MTMTNFELLLIVAAVLFAVSSVIQITLKAWPGALLAAGLTFTALAFVTLP